MACLDCAWHVHSADQLQAQLVEAMVDKAVAEAKVAVYEESIQDLIAELRTAQRELAEGLPR